MTTSAIEEVGTLEWVVQHGICLKVFEQSRHPQVLGDVALYASAAEMDEVVKLVVMQLPSNSEVEKRLKHEK